MKKVKYVIKATKFKDNTYEDVVFENQPLSQKQETFSDVKHILDLDFENALDEGKKVQYDGVELDIFNEDGTILKEWIQDVAKGNGVTNHHSTIYRAMKYEETFKSEVASIEAMLYKAKQRRKEYGALNAIIYMKGWLEVVYEELNDFTLT